MNEENNELPRGWTTAQLGSFTDVLGGSTPSRNESRYFGGSIVWLTPTEIPKETVSIISDSKEKITEEGFKESGVRWIPEGSVLLTSRASIGYVGIAGTQLTTNQGFASFVLPRGVEPKYLGWWLKSQKNTLEDLARGTTFKEISKATLKDVWAPIAPLAEQHRIVAAIEEQFTRLDAGVAVLRRAQTKLKRYRAAVLKAAVEGKLTETWRAEHPETEPASTLLERILKERRTRWETDLKAKGKDPAKMKYIEPAKANTEHLPELPEGWCWGTVEQVGDVQLGRQRAPQHHTGPYMRPYLRVANVFEDRIDTSDILTMNFTPEEFQIYQLKFGDVLLNEGQSLELIGRPAIYRDEVPGACFQNTLIRFRAYSGLMAKHALTVFRVYLHSQRFQRIGKHTTNIAHLGAGRFAALEFPLPPLAEQEQIVAEVEQRLSVITQLESIVEANLKRAKRLRQSILKEAFAGRLVPQNPDDEPASVLLERIRKERDRRKRETASNGRYVHVPDEPVQKIHVEETQQAGLWESVGG